MRVLVSAVLIAVSLLLYASLWAPGIARVLYWGQKGRPAVRPLGFVSRLGFTVMLGALTLMLVVGASSVRLRGIYLGIMLLGFLLAMLGFVNDWLRDKA